MLPFVNVIVLQNDNKFELTRCRWFCLVNQIIENLR